MLKCQWWPCKGPMHTICNQCVMHTSKVRMASLESDSLLPYCLIFLPRSFMLRDPWWPVVLTSGCWWPNARPAPQHHTPCPASWQQCDLWTCWWKVPTCPLAPHLHRVVVRPVITKTQLVHSVNNAEKYTTALHMHCVPGSSSHENYTLNQDLSSKQAA